MRFFISRFANVTSVLLFLFSTALMVRSYFVRECLEISLGSAYAYINSYGGWLNVEELPPDKRQQPRWGVQFWEALNPADKNTHSTEPTWIDGYRFWNVKLGARRAHTSGFASEIRATSRFGFHIGSSRWRHRRC